MLWKRNLSLILTQDCPTTLVHENLMQVLQLYLIQQSFVCLGVLPLLVRICCASDHFDPDSRIITKSAVGLLFTVCVCECECCAIFHLMHYPKTQHFSVVKCLIVNDFEWGLDAYTLWDWLSHLPKFEWMGHGTKTIAQWTSEDPHATRTVWACGTLDWLHRSLCKTRTFDRVYREQLWKPLYIWHTTSTWFSSALCWRTLCTEFLIVFTFHVLHAVASNTHTQSLCKRLWEQQVCK